MSDPASRIKAAQFLRQAAQEVLETMFFVTVLGDAPEDAASPSRLCVQLRFQGSPPGWFRLSLCHAAARSVATGFCGAEAEGDLSEAQVESVVRELANVICGAALSRLESDSAFELQAPEIVPCPGQEDASEGARCSLLLDCGALDLWLSLDATS
jgi:CheY-specific phosphatase CheX